MEISPTDPSSQRGNTQQHWRGEEKHMIHACSGSSCLHSTMQNEFFSVCMRRNSVLRDGPCRNRNAGTKVNVVTALRPFLQVRSTRRGSLHSVLFPTSLPLTYPSLGRPLPYCCAVTSRFAVLLLSAATLVAICEWVLRRRSLLGTPGNRARTYLGLTTAMQPHNVLFSRGWAMAASCPSRRKEREQEGEHHGQRQQQRQQHRRRQQVGR